jgi:hypothetical protein
VAVFTKVSVGVEVAVLVAILDAVAVEVLVGVDVAETITMVAPLTGNPVKPTG